MPAPAPAPELEATPTPEPTPEPVTGSAEPPPPPPPPPLPPPLPPPQQQQHTEYTSETEVDGEGGSNSDTEMREGSTEPVAAPPAPPAAAPNPATAQRGNKKASPPAAPDYTSLSTERTDSQSTQSTQSTAAAPPPFRPLATAPFPFATGSRGSVKIRKHCAGHDTAHLIPDMVDSRLRDEDWLCVPFAELEKQYKVQCTKCSFTFDITRAAAEKQQKEMIIEAGGRATIEL